MNDNLILIDWFAFSCKMILDPAPIIDYLGLNDINWNSVKGHYGYRAAFHYGGMWILYDGADDMGVCVEFSGQGCRQYESSGSRPLSELVDQIAGKLEYHITRLDVAFDDIDHDGKGLLDISKIFYLTLHDRYISKFRGAEGQYSKKHSNDGNQNPPAFSIYFGSAQSNIRFRIYDKSLERGGLGYHWVRFEMQLRDECALNFLRQPGTIGTKFCGVVNNYLRFIVPSKDSNRRRWPSPVWWTAFLSSADRISLFSRKGVDYNLHKLEKFLFRQAANSCLTYINCVGLKSFVKMLQARDLSHLSDNQRKLISEYNAARAHEQKGLDSDPLDFDPWILDS